MTDRFYRAFEDRFRGSRELIKSRLRVYLPFIEPLKSIYGTCRAVDLGCGRGEWLELLLESGFEATGVDSDEGMLAACVELTLPAERGDAISHLRCLPGGSMAVVSGFHVAEHLPFADLQALVQEAVRVLKPAGLLILETPNPENLVVGTSGFYCDPTHQRPVPPTLLSFLLEFFGFARVKVLRLQERPELASPASVTLSDVLTGVSPDFAVVAQKPTGDPEHAARFDGCFERDFGIGLGSLARRYDQGIAARFAQVEGALARLAELQTQLDHTQQALHSVLGSTSWRLTAPLRRAASWVRFLFGPGRHRGKPLGAEAGTRSRSPRAGTDSNN